MKTSNEVCHPAVVPEWLLDAAISDCAIRLYAVLLRYGHVSRNVRAATLRGTVVMLSPHLAFECDATGPSNVRRWLSDALRAALPSDPSPDSLIEDALVVTTELVTNAINAGCTNGQMSWTLALDCLQLEVFDNAPGWPVRQNPSPADTHGRGLLIVQALAVRRGTKAVDGGKVASAALQLPF